MYPGAIDSRQQSVERSVTAPLGPALGVPHDGSSSVETSRGLLMTVLGEFVLPHGGTAWTQTLVALMDALGVRDKAARQTLARMHDRGWLNRERVGRRTRWTLTDHSTALLEAGAERIYGFGQHARPWDGTWVVLLASVPERDRRVRYRMGIGLSWAGFGSLGQGVWLSPWAQQEQAAVELLEGLTVEATSFRARLGELGSGSALARQAWDLPRLRARYDAFVADTDVVLASLPKGEAAAVELATLVHRWRRFPFLDPDLPAALLPSDWPGPFAARRFADLRAALIDEASSWWEATEAAGQRV